MRVALINSESGWRGGEEHARLLVSGLPSGVEVLAVGQPGSPFLERMGAAGVRTLPLAMGSGMDVGAMWRMRGMLMQEGIQVANAATSRAHGLAVLGLMGTGLPVVVTRHLDFPIGRGSRWKYRAATAVACVSQRVAQAVLAAGVPANRVHVVRNGIAREPYARGRTGILRRELGIPSDAVVTLCIGALTAQKDHGTLLDAWESVAPHRPQAWLVLLGDGDLRAQVLERAARLPRVVLAGFRQDLPQVVADADLLALTSRNEGLPLAVLEAQAAGLPVVATDAGGTREVVDQACGRLLPVGDAAAVGRALAEVIDDPGLRHHLGSAARLRSQAYDHRSMAAGMVATWQTALDQAQHQAGRR